jgi:two-component system, chemotaxis family, response regulator Rcp1
MFRESNRIPGLELLRNVSARYRPRCRAGAAAPTKLMQVFQRRWWSNGSVSNARESVNVLLVEDSPGDVLLMSEVLCDANRSIRLHVVGDGVEAMAFLMRNGPHALAPRPALILLDLNLPKMDGREVLARIKNDDSLKTIPTIILTTSAAIPDIAKMYQLHANCYLTKPIQFDAFEALVKSINDFWLTKATLAHHSQSA